MSLFNSYNRVVLLGNLTRDIELRTTPSGTRVCDIALAVNERVKKGQEWVDETTFVDITAWGKTAELLERFGAKGKPLLVEGKLKLDRWVDKQSGQNRQKLKVTADALTFLDGAGGSRGGMGGGSSQMNQSAPQDDMPYSQQIQEDDEAIPF